MRFFSNESRESNDDQSNVDVRTRAEQENPDQASDDHPERVQSDPVSVPQQRAGSPWSDAPKDSPATDADHTDADRTDPDRPDVDDADAELADQERADGTDESPAAGRDDDGVDMALDDRGDFDDPQVKDATPENSTPESTATTYSPDGTVTTNADTEPATDDTTDEAADGTADDAALKDDGDFDDPTAVDPATDRPIDGDTDRETDTDGDSGGLIHAEGAHASHDAEDGKPIGHLAGDEPVGHHASPATDSDDDDDSDDDEGKHVGHFADESDDNDDDGPDGGKHVGHDEPVTDALPDDTVHDDTTTNGHAAGDGASVPVTPIPVPVGATDDSTTQTADDKAADNKPGSVTAPDLGSLFAEADAQAFHDRWRDVQLRFVDSPQEATADASSLLDEAVEKLAASLRAQKDGLASSHSDDTEQLRVELRGYREILTRILNL